MTFLQQQKITLKNIFCNICFTLFRPAVLCKSRHFDSVLFGKQHGSAGLQMKLFSWVKKELKSSAYLKVYSNGKAYSFSGCL